MCSTRVMAEPTVTHKAPLSSACGSLLRRADAALGHDPHPLQGQRT
jgi:hypothetical protein